MTAPWTVRGTGPVSRTGLIDTQEPGPLCPYSGGPWRNEAHRLRVRFVDAGYRAAERIHSGDENDPSEDPVYRAVAADESLGDRMHLYRAEVAAKGGYVLPSPVEALWFQCPTCGFVLPAQQIPAGT